MKKSLQKILYALVGFSVACIVLFSGVVAFATAYPSLVGDVNMDGDVNPLDVVILARHVANWKGYEELPYLGGSSGEDESDNLTFAAANVPASAGSANVEVTIAIKNNPGILGTLLSVEFDESVLTLKNATNGSGLGSLTYMKPSRYESGSNFVWYGNEPGNTADDTVLTLVFSVSSNAAAGKYPITVTCSASDTYDVNYETVAVDVVNGSIIVS